MVRENALMESLEDRRLMSASLSVTSAANASSSSVSLNLSGGTKNVVYEVDRTTGGSPVVTKLYLTAGNNGTVSLSDTSVVPKNSYTYKLVSTGKSYSVTAAQLEATGYLTSFGGEKSQYATELKNPYPVSFLITGATLASASSIDMIVSESGTNYSFVLSKKSSSSSQITAVDTMNGETITVVLDISGGKIANGSTFSVSGQVAGNSSVSATA